MNFDEYPKTRFVIYGLSILAAVAATFVAVESAEYGEAFDRAANILAVAAGATALAKISPKQAETSRPQVAADPDEFPDLEVHEYGPEGEWDPAEFDEPDVSERDGSNDPDIWTGPQNAEEEPSGRYGDHRA